MRTHVLFQHYVYHRSRPGSDTACWQPATDVFYRGAELVVRLELAGVDPQDLEVELSNRRVIISGSRVDRVPRDQFMLMEIPFGEFGVSVEIPPNFVPDRERITFTYSDGFLSVVLPALRTEIV